jgi:CHASE3 domain sensor protein
MNKKIVRTFVLAATLLAGFAANSYAGLIAAPVPVPQGTPR